MTNNIKSPNSPSPTPPLTTATSTKLSTDENSPTDDPLSSNSTNACAACRFQRRRCVENCPLAPYFPAHNYQQFINAYKIFGVNKIVKALISVDPSFRDDAMTSLIYSANARALDPVGGCKQIIDCLQAQIAYYEKQLNDIRAQIAAFKAGASTGFPPPFRPFRAGVSTDFPASFRGAQVQVPEALPLSPARFRKHPGNVQEDIKPIPKLSNKAKKAATQFEPENKITDNQAKNVAAWLEHKLEDETESLNYEQKPTKRKSVDKFGKHKKKRIKHSSFDSLDDHFPCYNTFCYPS